MNTNRKIRVAVLYGGPSSEHEISLRSAASVIQNLDRSRFEVIPIWIDRSGRWMLGEAQIEEQGGNQVVLAPKNGAEVVLPPSFKKPSGSSLLSITGAEAEQVGGIDVFFPALHGPLLEDGSIQGLFELADKPYVGAGVLGSAIGMDKDIAKRLALTEGIPVVPWLVTRRAAWSQSERDAELARLQRGIDQECGYPVFVKPATLGSSVGVHKVSELKQLEVALKDAFQFDEKVLIERAVNAREIEFAVLEDIKNAAHPLVSVPGEIIPSHDFYSYEAKYLDENGAELVIPAQLDDSQLQEATRIARQAFVALECEGMARVDLFFDRDQKKFLFNEVNTIPGFTSISMYPKLLEATGIPYSELLTRLVDLAILRHDKRKKLVRERGF